MDLEACGEPTSSDTNKHRPQNDSKIVLLTGIVWKWTNFLMGWQERYFELRNGILVYYKSETEKQFGSRGSITLRCANVEENMEDPTRFEISTNGVVWYLKADSQKSKKVWLCAIRAHLVGSQHDKVKPFHYVPSTSKCVDRPDLIVKLNDKISELKKSREVARLQLETLHQRIGAILRNTVGHVENVSLKEEGLAFDYTTAVILRDLTICVDLLTEQLEQPISPKTSSSVDLDIKKEIRNEEDQEEDEDGYAGSGPLQAPTVANSTGFLSDSEWHDALEVEDEIVESPEMKFLLNSKENSKNQKETVEIVPSISPSGILTLPPTYALADEINRVTLEQLRYAKAGVEDNIWELFSEEGEMKMYKMDMEVDGLVCDPLKAIHCIKGVTAREYIHFFYEPEYKEEWDETLDAMTVVETVSADTSIIHQVHKRVWPAAQRESLFWSHVRQVNSKKDPDAHDLFIVCNHDTERADVPLVSASNVRVGVTVAMVCQTLITKEGPYDHLSRDDVQCRITYVAQVHPGGWVPSGALRVVYKREYPKFLRGFTKYVVRRLNNRPLCL